MANPNRMGIRLHILDRIINDLNSRPELQAIFGVPVSRALVVVADGNDLRIEEGGQVKVSRDDEEVFLRILGEVVAVHES